MKSYNLSGILADLTSLVRLTEKIIMGKVGTRLVKRVDGLGLVLYVCKQRERANVYDKEISPQPFLFPLSLVHSLSVPIS